MLTLILFENYFMRLRNYEVDSWMPCMEMSFIQNENL